MDEQDIIDFVFLENVQHPLSIGRLCVLAFYGPLGSDKNMRSGMQKSHILQAFEIDEMCLEIERDILLEIYVRDQRIRSCSLEDQQFIISQADSNLKRCKGKGFLRQLTKTDVRQILHHLPKTDDGKIQFLDFQQTIEKYRAQLVCDLRNSS